MKKIPLICILLGITLQSRAQVEVDMYVEVGDAYIFLTRNCSIDGAEPCNCAVADEALAPDFKDAMMCWTQEGDKITFRNHRFNIEKRASDVKVKITDPNPSGASGLQTDTTHQPYPAKPCADRRLCS